MRKSWRWHGREGGWRGMESSVEHRPHFFKKRFKIMHVSVDCRKIICKLSHSMYPFYSGNKIGRMLTKCNSIQGRGGGGEEQSMLTTQY